MRGISLSAGLFILLIITCYSCITEGCNDPGESMAVITLHKADNDDIITTDSLTIYGVGMDNLLLYNKSNTAEIELPLNPVSGYTGYVIVNGLIHDTLEITYTATKHFISKACGYNFLYTIEDISYTKNRIDTILIINKTVNPLNEENLRTFF